MAKFKTDPNRSFSFRGKIVQADGQGIIDTEDEEFANALRELGKTTNVAEAGADDLLDEGGTDDDGETGGTKRRRRSTR